MTVKTINFLQIIFLLIVSLLIWVLHVLCFSVIIVSASSISLIIYLLLISLKNIKSELPSNKGSNHVRGATFDIDKRVILSINQRCESHMVSLTGNSYYTTNLVTSLLLFQAKHFVELVERDDLPCYYPRTALLFCNTFLYMVEHERMITDLPQLHDRVHENLSTTTTLLIHIYQ